MKDVTEEMKSSTEEMPSIGLVEIGAASKLTKGISIYTPWFELANPPFIYTCGPYC
jgi:hypothetical protein